MTVTLQPTSKSGDTAACTLASGYNLVGNSFGSIAKLPSGVTVNFAYLEGPSGAKIELVQR